MGQGSKAEQRQRAFFYFYFAFERHKNIAADYLRENHEENTGELLKLANRATGDLKQQIDATEAAYGKFRLTAPIHMKTTTRGSSGERTASATNVHQENLAALELEQQRLLVQKADVQSKIQSLQNSLDVGQSREELATMIQLFAAPQSKSGQNPALLAAGGGANSFDGQLLPLILREKQLLLEFGEDWPEVKTVRAQIATLRQYYIQGGVPDAARSQERVSADRLSSIGRGWAPARFDAVFLGTRRGSGRAAARGPVSRELRRPRAWQCGRLDPSRVGRWHWRALVP